MKDCLRGSTMRSASMDQPKKPSVSPSSSWQDEGLSSSSPTSRRLGESSTANQCRNSTWPGSCRQNTGRDCGAESCRPTAPSRVGPSTRCWPCRRHCVRRTSACSFRGSPTPWQRSGTSGNNAKPRSTSSCAMDVRVAKGFPVVVRDELIVLRNWTQTLLTLARIAPLRLSYRSLRRRVFDTFHRRRHQAVCRNSAFDRVAFRVPHPI